MEHLITLQEIEDLPEEPRQRFVGIEKICRERYSKAAAQCDDEWSALADCRLQYMGNVIGAAKYLKIEPLDAWDLPRKSTFDNSEFENFFQEVQFYLMQMMLQAAEFKRQTVIILEGGTQQRLQTLSQHLRIEIRKLDLSEGRIDRLIGKLDAFERELNNPRLPILAVAIVTMAIMHGIAQFGEDATSIRKLVNEVQELVGGVKEEQDAEVASQIPSALEPRRLEPPRQQTSQPPSIREEFSADVDDEIPF